MKGYKVRKIVLLTALLYSFAFAASGCLLTQQRSVDVTWKAYKTFAKIGVRGEFTSINYTPAAVEGKNFKELLVGSTVKIDKSKISTGNPARDETIVKMFFDKLKGETIEAKIVDIKSLSKHKKGEVKKGIVTVEISMNGKKLPIPMSYTYKDGEFRAEGTIDLFDFGAQKALGSINRGCYDLHEGKTWSDVTIGFHTKITASLCDVKRD